MRYALFELQQILDNPKFEGFAFSRNDSLLGAYSLTSDFVPDRRIGRTWSVPRLAPIWKPATVVGRVRSYNDYPCINLAVPAFSRRAVDALRDFLEPNGELLPLISSVGEYYAYNVTTVADILDQEKSKFIFTSGGDRSIINIFDVERYECLVAKMIGLSIFRLVETGSQFYVTQAFVDRAKSQGLQGFHFVKLWPLPPGVRWKDIYKKGLKENAEITTKRGKENVKGNSVVLRLRADDGATPSQAEMAEIERLMDELDALLISQATNAPEAGSLEGHEWVGIDCRLYFSCPDPDKLVSKLWPWLKSLHWAGEVMLMKRQGEYHDASAREEYVDLSGGSPRYQSPVIAERPLTDEERAEVASCAAEGCRLVKIDSNAKPDEAQTAIHAWLEEFRQKRRRWSKEKIQDAALALGSLWGRTVCDALGWQWVAAKLISRDTEGHAVVPPERQCVVFPLENFFAILEGTKQHVNTRDSLELFESLKSGEACTGNPKDYRIVD